MRVLHGRDGDIAPFEAGIGTALDEVDPRHRRHPHQFVDGVDHRPLDQAHHHQPLL